MFRLPVADDEAGDDDGDQDDEAEEAEASAADHSDQSDVVEASEDESKSQDEQEDEEVQVLRPCCSVECRDTNFFILCDAYVRYYRHRTKSSRSLAVPRRTRVRH